MEPTIVIIAVVVITAGAVLWARAMGMGNQARQVVISRRAWNVSATFAVIWVIGVLFTVSILEDIGIVGAVAAAAVAAYTSQQIAKK